MPPPRRSREWGASTRDKIFEKPEKILFRRHRGRGEPPRRRREPLLQVFAPPEARTAGDEGVELRFHFTRPSTDAPLCCVMAAAKGSAIGSALKIT